MEKSCWKDIQNLFLISFRFQGWFLFPLLLFVFRLSEQIKKGPRQALTWEFTRYISKKCPLYWAAAVAGKNLF